jgi:hypothetical protein
MIIEVSLQLTFSKAEREDRSDKDRFKDYSLARSKVILQVVGIE